MAAKFAAPAYDPSLAALGWVDNARPHAVCLSVVMLSGYARTRRVRSALTPLGSVLESHWPCTPPRYN